MRDEAHRAIQDRWNRSWRGRGWRLTGGLLLAAVLALVVGSAGAAPSPADPAVSSEDLLGTWEGTVTLGEIQRQVGLRVESQEGRGLAASLVIGDYGRNKWAHPTLEVSDETGAVSVWFEGRGASFKGTLTADGRAIDGTWTDDHGTAPLKLVRTAGPEDLEAPEESSPAEDSISPFTHEELDVTFRNQAAGTDLEGQLILPEGEGPFPAVLFVDIDASPDRDESQKGYRPLTILADVLPSYGIATLRYHRPEMDTPNGKGLNGTVEDHTADAVAGVGFLARQPRIDPHAIGILDDGFPGPIGLGAAVRDDHVRFLVLLSPSVEPADQPEVRATADFWRRGGVDEALIRKALPGHADLLALIKDESLGTEELAEKLRAQLKSYLSQFTDAEKFKLGMDGMDGMDERFMIDMGIDLGTRPWFRSRIRQEPAKYLEQIRIPVLALFGGDSNLVSAEINAPLLRAALKKAGNDDFEVGVFPSLDGSLQHTGTGHPGESGPLAEEICPMALEIIGTWIGERFVHGKSSVPKAP